MKLVVVDIQPEYESNTPFDIGDMLRKAAEDYSEVLFLFNGEDTLGMISESALKDFYFEKLDYDEEAFEDLLGKSTFFDKGYGFFRDVMDSEVCFDRSSIVKIVKYMIDNDVQDIRDLDEDDVDAIGVSELLFDDLEDYGFYLPELADELPRWSGSDLAGGARNECMAEVEILGAAQGLSFNHIDDFIYEGESRYSSVMTESLLRSYIRELLTEKFYREDFKDVYNTARMAHVGQTRRDGSEYFSHPSEVRNITAKFYPNDRVAQMAALLHDSLEDAPGSTVESAEEMEDFIRGSIQDPRSADEVIRVVRALTHEKGGDYQAYVVDLLNDITTLRVKLSDMVHNLSDNPTPKSKAKYRAALDQIAQITQGKPPSGISKKHWEFLINLAGEE